jgi:hypothetical protein
VVGTGRDKSVINVHDGLVIEIDFTLLVDPRNFNLNIVFYRAVDGYHMTKITSQNFKVGGRTNSGRYTIKTIVNELNLSLGNYVILSAFFDGHGFLYRNVIHALNVVSDGKVTFPNSILELNAQMEMMQTS